jgi:hypothetical protein
MGFLNIARDLMREHGRVGLMTLRRTGKIVAPALTRRVSSAVHKNKRLIASVTNTLDSAVDVVDAATVGDLAGGMHATAKLGQSATALYSNVRKSNKRMREQDALPQTKAKKVKQNNSTLDNFDSNAANDPKISGDLLARMTKSVRT